MASALTVHFSDSITGCFDSYVAKTMHVHSGAGMNIKVGGGTFPVLEKSFVMPLHILALQLQLVILVSAFVMVTTAWSVSCLPHSAPPHVQPFVKVGGTCPHALWSMELQPLHVRGMTNTSLCIR